jgi:aspartyl/asparaginyl beta-hydroxylase (cupin superfamily)
MSSIDEKISDTSVKPWYSYQGVKYDGKFPAFFDPENWKWIRESEKIFPAIRLEIEKLLSQKNNILEPYFNSSLVNENGKWEVVNFYFWGKENKTNCDSCPELNRLLKSIPGMLSAGISRLAPHTEIHPHFGDTNMILRCHLGLSIPEGLPNCGLKVKDETREWQNGKWLVFCDAHEHSAWNKTDKFRYILIVDVALPEFVEKKKNIAANVRSLLLLQKKLDKNPWMKKLPGLVLALMRRWYKYLG